MATSEATVTTVNQLLRPRNQAVSVQTDAGGNDVIKLCTLTPLTTIPDIEAFKTSLGG